MADQDVLPATLRPFLQQGVRAARLGESLVLATDLSMYQFDGADAAHLGRILPLLDGARTLEDIALDSGFDLEMIRSMVEPLYCEALLAERTDVSLPALLVYEHARNCGLLWHALSSWRDPLPKLIATGRIDAALVLGLLIEEWHYVSSNPIHASTAVLKARAPRLRRLWAEFAAEEYEHGAWLESGLARVLTAEQLRWCRPLPGTAALCNQMRAVAESNQLGYAACLALCEQSNDSASADLQSEYYASLKALHVLADEVFEPYERHTLTDIQAGHLAFTRIPFEQHGALTLVERLDLLGHVWDHVRAYEYFYRNIYEFYGSAGARLYAAPGTLPETSLPVGPAGGLQGMGSTSTSRSSLV